MLAAVAVDGRALEHASEALKADKEVVLAAVAQWHGALQHASEALKADREVVLAAVAQDGDALKHASEALKADREVVLAAMTQDGNALQHASEDLRADGDAVLAGAASFWADRAYVLAAVTRENAQHATPLSVACLDAIALDLTTLLLEAIGEGELISNDVVISHPLCRSKITTFEESSANVANERGRSKFLDYHAAER